MLCTPIFVVKMRWCFWCWCQCWLGCSPTKTVICVYQWFGWLLAWQKKGEKSKNIMNQRSVGFLLIPNVDWILPLQQSTRCLTYHAMFIKGMSFAISYTRPCDETSSCKWIYSKNVLLVQQPAHWISSANYLFKYRVIAPPALSECDPILDSLNPAFPVSQSAFTGSFTASIMWELRTCCQGKATELWKVHINVSSVAFICTKSTALATTAFTRQHVLKNLSVYSVISLSLFVLMVSPFFKAWWDKMSPFWPFFWFSMVKDMSVMCSTLFSRFTGRICWSFAKNYISQPKLLCVALSVVICVFPNMQ